MPTLNWIGKEAVVRHHREVPFRLLEPVPELSCGGADSGNLIVQGDNLHALKALLPRYAGQVKCIYVDPPYNTGNEGWVYNDKIRRWLGAVVGKEGETLDRHDRWLCMMYPRLVLLKQFLREDGSIWISMDDSEIASLRLLMDEIYGRSCFIACNAWQKRYSRIESEFMKLKAMGRVYFGKDGSAQPSTIRYLSEVEGFVPWTWWPHEEVGHTDESRKEIQDIFGTQTAFDTPKPTRLIQRILHSSGSPRPVPATPAPPTAP